MNAEKQTDVIVRVTSICSTVFVVIFDNNRVQRVYTGAAWEYHSVYKWRTAFAQAATSRTYYSDPEKEEDGGVTYDAFTIDSVEAAEKVVHGADYKMKRVYPMTGEGE